MFGEGPGKVHKALFDGHDLYREQDGNKQIEDMFYDTRLIGFRTSKYCKGDQNIKSIQPIYYSLNENICKNELEMVTDDMMEEIQGYGLDCEAFELREHHIKSFASEPEEYIKASDAHKGIDIGFQRATEVAIWAIGFVIIALGGFATHEYCEERWARIEAKRTGMVAEQ